MKAIKETQSFMIEGNIGAGKSTFLRLVEDKLPVQVVYEPLAKWQNVGIGENLLDQFYQDTKRWAYTFQSYAFLTRLIEQREQALVNPYTHQIVERSVYSDRYCFAKNCFEMGTISSLEWSLYQEWFDWLVTHFNQKPSGIIYLKTTPEVCYTRLKKRERDEEKAIPLAYLESLHAKHENWLIKGEYNPLHLKNVPILVLDCDKEFESDSKQMDLYLQQIAEFMNLNQRVAMPSGFSHSSL